jgi:predicted Zn-dependent peptidase
LGRAEILAEYTSFFGDPGLVDKDVEAYLNVTTDDIQRVAGKMFNHEGSTTVDVVPAKKKES